MIGCDMCDRDVPSEVLCFEKPGENWRVASVCGECRKEKLMPALRRLFVDGGINLAPSEEDPWETVQVPPGASFFSFETKVGTTHAAREVEEHISSPDEYRCVSLCGIESSSEPKARTRQLSEQREGPVCGRCREADPYYFEHNEE